MRRPIARDINQRKRAVGSQVANWASGYPSFAPNHLPGLQLWLDASDISTITESGGSVSQWNDKSGNAYHVSQGVGANQPVTNSVFLNGLNTIDFDGSNDVLERTTDTDLLRNVSGSTIYVMHKPDVLTAPAGGFRAVIRIEVADPSTVSRAQLSAPFTSAAGTLGSGGRTLDADSFINVNSSSQTGGNWFTHIAVYDYANTDLFQYVSGVLNGSNSSFQTATTTSNTASNNLRIGSGGLANTHFDGSMAEILVYHSAHTTQERASVLQYFKQKWNV